MEEINNFQQEPDETLYQAWERFKELLIKCPQHYLTEMQELAAYLAEPIYQRDYVVDMSVLSDIPSSLRYEHSSTGQHVVLCVCAECSGLSSRSVDIGSLYPQGYLKYLIDKCYINIEDIKEYESQDHGEPVKDALLNFEFGIMSRNRLSVFRSERVAHYKIDSFSLHIGSPLSDSGSPSENGPIR
ncbi:hypothetical protein Tco_0060078 [Tanacetum coccineum]